MMRREAIKMNHVIKIFVLLPCVFILLFSSSGLFLLETSSDKNPARSWQDQTEDDNLPVVVIKSSDDSVHTFDSIRNEQDVKHIIYTLNQNVLRNMALFLVFIFCAVLYFLSMCKRKFPFLHYRRHAYYLARFLCDLNFQKSKDGKKKVLYLRSEK